MHKSILLLSTLAFLAAPLGAGAADKVLMYTGNGGNAGYGFSQVEAGMLAAGATSFDATTTWPADLSDYRVVFLFLNETAFSNAQIAQIIMNGRGAMPKFDLPKSTIDNLVKLIRLLGPRKTTAATAPSTPEPPRPGPTPPGPKTPAKTPANAAPNQPPAPGLQPAAPPGQPQ